MSIYTWYEQIERLEDNTQDQREEAMLREIDELAEVYRLARAVVLTREERMFSKAYEELFVLVMKHERHRAKGPMSE